MRTDNSEPEFPSDLYAEPLPREVDDDEPDSSGDVQQDELERALEAQYLADGRSGLGPSIHEREQWRKIRREAAIRQWYPTQIAESVYAPTVRRQRALARIPDNGRKRERREGWVDGAELRRRREALGLTGFDLARVLGLKRLGTVSEWERGRIRITNPRILRYALEYLALVGVEPSKGPLLSAEQVRELRAAHARGDSLAVLAARYGVSRSTVSNVVKERRKRYVDLKEG